MHYIDPKDLPDPLANAMTTTNTYMHLPPLPPSSLPSHTSLSSAQPPSLPSVSLKTFITGVLLEALELADSTLPKQFTTKSTSKPSPPSTANVETATRSVSGEFWVARTSEHENAAKEGTASYEEFESGLFDDHSVHEAEYTPDVYAARKICDWSEQIAALPTHEGIGSGLESVHMELYEMCHNLPSPLTHRCFATLVLRAKTGSSSFIVAQIPVDLSKTESAFFSNGRNRTAGTTTLEKDKVVLGRYVSVERVRRQADGENGKIVWQMATASDAGGYLPMSVQKMGVLGAVVKDVGFFMGWCAGKRKEGGA